MSFDAHKNLAISTVATAPSPATSGTTLSVTAGEGGRFPAAPFNATVWPASQPPTPTNAELVRVTARTSDSLTITRAVESSTARSIVAGDLIAATITAQVITDIESGTNFPQLATPGTGAFGGNLNVSVNQNAGVELILAQNISGGPNSFASMSLRAGANSANGLYAFSDGFTTSGPNVQNGLALYASWGGGISMAATHGAGNIRFYTGGAIERGRMYATGGFSWGGTTDPGTGNLMIAGPAASGVAHVFLGKTGLIESGCAGSAGFAHIQFVNANGVIGSIASAASGTTYNTTSDQRLKTDRGLITDPGVLRSTKVHHFTWNTDGTTGRGVFAQEAIAVLPAAVSIGTDERDDEGRLKTPWGVDYSKYVPDLIAGWQHHDAEVIALKDQVATLETSVAVLQAQVARLLARIG